MGRHWSHCGYPDIPDRWMEMLRGLLMGDGCVHTHGKTPCFIISMANESFLQWLDWNMWWIFSGVRKSETAEQSREGIIESFGPEGVSSVDEYSDMHRLQSFTHSGLETLQDWYNDGQKRYPDDLSLSPMSAKMWYVTDGGLRKRSSDKANPNCAIACVNESHREDFLLSLFEEHGFNPSFDGASIVFSVEDSRELLDWMGTPPPGFVYKWEEIIPLDDPSNQPWKDAEWLEDQYHGNGKSLSDIADDLPITHSAVGYWMDKHGIETRGPGPNTVQT